MKLKRDTFPRSKTCTDKPAEWIKRRVDGIRSDPVMSATVIKPKYGSTSKGIKSTLYEARAGEARQCLHVNKLVADKLSNINPLFGACLTVGHTSDSTTTKMGIEVPKGSPLSYQIAATEGDFLVSENVDTSVETKTQPWNSETEQPPVFPWHPASVPDTVPPEDIAALNLAITQQTASDIFADTIKQAESNLWFSVREKRLTASKFGIILQRKKDIANFVKSNLCKRSDLSNVPAIKFGKDNERKGKEEYRNYMNNTNRTCKIYESGCVINSAFPWLAASPDGIVYHKDVGYGLVEVKCSYSKRNVTPLDACKDPAFFCFEADGKVHLKDDHAYYAQVQGQLGVCGASYCDFVVYTNKGLSIERITFNAAFWKDMTEKLGIFFSNYFVPVVKTYK